MLAKKREPLHADVRLFMLTCKKIAPRFKEGTILCMHLVRSPHPAHWYARTAEAV